MSQIQEPNNQDIVSLQAEVGILRQQCEDYKGKYFQALKETESKNLEIENLRQIIQQTQSLKSTDPKQAEELRRALQQLQQENQLLKQNLLQYQQGQLQQPIGYQPQETLELQQRLLEYQNEVQRQANENNLLKNTLDGKTQDYNQLKTRVQAWEFINNLPQGQERNRQLVLEREYQRVNNMLDKKDKEIEGMRQFIEEQKIQMIEKENLQRQLREYEEKVIILSRQIEGLLTSVGGLRHEVSLKQQLDIVKQNLMEAEKESQQWKDKYNSLQNEAKNILEIDKIKKDLEDRIIQLQAINDKIELENRGLQLKQQAFDRLLKENENLQQKIQSQDAQIGELDKAISEKRREMEALRRKKTELEDDFINFRENVLRPQEDRAKRLEGEVEVWRNKCLALENNFFGNNDRMYVQSEIKRLNAIVLQLQQENEQLKMRLRNVRQTPTINQDNFVNEERLKILQSERERLFQDIEGLRRRNIQLEQEVATLKQIRPPLQSSVQPQHIQIIQEGNQQNINEDLLKEKDRQLEDFKQGIEILIDENKQIKIEMDKLQLQLEQVEIDKSYLLQKQNIRDQNQTALDILARIQTTDFNIRERGFYELAQKLNYLLQQKQQEIQQIKNGINTDTQKLLEQIQEKDQQIKQLISSISKQKDLQSSSPNKNLQDDAQNIEYMSQQLADLQMKLSEAESKKYNNFLQLIQAKDQEIEAVRRKFAELQAASNNEQNALFIRDIKRLKDLLEQKSYECEEWKDKFQLLQGQNRQKYLDKNVTSQTMLEQEYRKLRHLLDLKTVEVEEYKQRLQQSNFDSNINPNIETEYRKTKMLLEMRTAECEEWRQKYLRNQQSPSLQQNMQLINPELVLQRDEIIKQNQKILEIKNKECEEWRNRYAELIKNKDSSQSVHIDTLHQELKKYQKLHEVKHKEVQELHPKLEQLKDVQQERNALENQLRQVKQVLEQQIIENQNLKIKNNQMNQDGTQNYSSSMMERQIKELQTQVVQLKNDLQQAYLGMKNREMENDRLKSVTLQHKDQIQSIAMGHSTTERKAKDLSEQIDRLTQILNDKNREIEEMKNKLRQCQQTINTLGNENQELKKFNNSNQQNQSQIQIMAHKLQESEKKTQELKEQIVKVGNMLKDKAIECERLKKELQKIDSYKAENQQTISQIEQLKQQLMSKQKETEQYKQGLVVTQKKLQEKDLEFNKMKENFDKIQNAMKGFGVKI